MLRKKSIFFNYAIFFKAQYVERILNKIENTFKWTFAG